MTDLDLTGIRERAAAASPGPWEAGVEVGVLGASLVIRDARRSAVRLRDGVTTTPDAAFVAHSREDIPALLAEVDRLTARAERAEAALASIAALVDERGRWLESDDVLATIARATQAGGEDETPRRVLMTEPYDGHEPEATCPGCPHEPEEGEQR